MTRRRLPLMVWAIGAFPPNLPFRSCHEHFCSQVSVLGGMPLGSDLWEEGGKGIGNRNLLSSTAWAAAAISGSAYHGCFPFVIRTVRATPPDLMVATGRNVLRTQIPVLCRVPL